jgi:hypothetical protein
MDAAKINIVVNSNVFRMVSSPSEFTSLSVSSLIMHYIPQSQQSAKSATVEQPSIRSCQEFGRF